MHYQAQLVVNSIDYILMTKTEIWPPAWRGEARLGTALACYRHTMGGSTEITLTSLPRSQQFLTNSAAAATALTNCVTRPRTRPRISSRKLRRKKVIEDVELMSQQSAVQMLNIFWPAILQNDDETERLCVTRQTRTAVISNPVLPIGFSQLLSIEGP